MPFRALSRSIPADEHAASRRAVTLETPQFPEPHQEWSALLRVTFEGGRPVVWELEQFVLTMPGSRPRSFSAESIERSQPHLAQTLRKQADAWLGATLADR